MSSPQKLSPPKARFILHSERLGPLPLVNHFIDRIGLESLLDRHVPSDARCAVPHARALGVLLRSIIVEREPIYRQQETVHGFASGMFGIGSEEMNHLSDDRLGRALDHLFARRPGRRLSPAGLATKFAPNCVLDVRNVSRVWFPEALAGTWLHRRHIRCRSVASTDTAKRLPQGGKHSDDGPGEGAVHCTGTRGT